MQQGRGMLTKRIKEKSKELLDYEIDTKELRLMAYLQYIMCNEQKIKHLRTSYFDRNILSKWQKNNWIDGWIDNGGDYKINITKEFWDIICEIIYLGYVDLF